MSPAEIHQKIIERFGADAIESFNEAALDPYLIVKPAMTAEVVSFSQGRPSLSF